ncbi:DUF4192 domain-containing protein [Actinoplanes sp. NPDC048988]|uniref:DUF4192 domain-containing protein n=1 Tax=Actinoplanes sp. NPDC048988 TaxID=3363901 RepID=UPI00371A4834
MTPECSITVRTPAELITVTPYLVGFHPTDCVVVLGVEEGVIAFTARHDLPPPGGDVDAAPLATVPAGPEGRYFVIVGYGPAARVTKAVGQTVAALEGAGLSVRDALRVSDGRWWSYFCTELRCCPPDGTPCLPPHHPVAAAAVFRGMVALPSRRALVAVVAPVEGPAREAMVAATARARVREAELRAVEVRTRSGQRMRQKAGRVAVRTAEVRYRARAELTDDEAAWLGVLLVDTVMLHYALGRCGPEPWQLALWTGLVRRVEPAFVAGPAALLAYCAWRAGNWPLARVTLDRGLREEPGHRLLGVLDGLLAAGLTPDAVESLEPPPVKR